MLKAISVAYFLILFNNKNMENFTRDENTFEGSDLLEPLNFYKTQLKDAFHENGEEYELYLCSGLFGSEGNAAVMIKGFSVTELS